MALWQWHVSRYSDLWSWGSAPTRGSVSGPLLRSAGSALQPTGGGRPSEVSGWEAWASLHTCGAASGRHSPQGGRSREASSLLPALLGIVSADRQHCSRARVRRLTDSCPARLRPRGHAGCRPPLSQTNVGSWCSPRADPLFDALLRGVGRPCRHAGCAPQPHTAILGTARSVLARAWAPDAVRAWRPRAALAASRWCQRSCGALPPPRASPPVGRYRSRSFFIPGKPCTPTVSTSPPSDHDAREECHRLSEATRPTQPQRPPPPALPSLYLRGPL